MPIVQGFTLYSLYCFANVWLMFLFITIAYIYMIYLGGIHHWHSVMPMPILIYI